MAKSKTTNNTTITVPGQANMVDLAIQPRETVYEKVVEDMGGGITRTTFRAVKDNANG